MSKLAVAAFSVVGFLSAGAMAADVQTFDTDPTGWVKDRHAPQVFESAFFDGDYRLKLGLRQEGQQGNRATSALNSDFYNYQGMKYFTPNNPVGSTVSADLYVDSTWADGVRAGLWVTASNGNLSYPIIEYATQETDSGTQDGFRYWQSGVGWTSIANNVAADQWYKFEIGLTGSQVTFAIIDLLNDVQIFSASVDNQHADSFDNIILQGHNKGIAGEYDIYWDNVVTGNIVPLPAAAWAGMALLGGMGGAGWLKRRRQA